MLLQLDSILTKLINYVVSTCLLLKTIFSVDFHSFSAIHLQCIGDYGVVFYYGNFNS